MRDATPFTGPDGEERHYEYIFVPVFAQDGSVEAVSGSSNEITERMRTEAELRRMNRELEEFAYVASHDLREPLRMINIYTELILANVDESDRVMKMYGGFVRQGVERMEMLIRDLLTFSAHDSERIRDVKETADLSEALSQALTLLDDRIKASGARIIAQELPLVCGDTGQLAHVFQNLISNALKYSRPGVVPEIEISCTRNGTRCEIAVRDNGIGFEPQSLTGFSGCSSGCILLHIRARVWVWRFAGAFWSGTTGRFGRKEGPGRGGYFLFLAGDCGAAGFVGCHLVSR